MRSFGDLPIRQKLTFLNVLTSALTLLLACIAFVAFERVTFRSAILQKLSTQAQIVGINSAAAVLFDDPTAAAATLAALKAEPNILAAAVYRKDGQRFATFFRKNTADSALDVRVDGLESHRFLPDRLLVVRPIVVDGERVGAVGILSDLGELTARINGYLGIAALVFLAAVLAAVAIAWRAQQVISEPILHLVDTARSVSNEKNYALRAAPSGDDEIGLLIRTFNDMLAQIQERDTELERARDEAEAGNRAKDEFLAVVSHELRTPLTPILSWTRLLGAGKLDGAATRRALESIERNVKAQSQLIEDLLDVSRIIAGKVRLDIQQVELGPLIESAVESTRPAADAKGIRMQVLVDPRAGAVAADPHRVQQVLWNLLSNAVKFTPKGGRVQIQLQRVNSHLEVSVSDTGQGIKPEFLPHVFDRFRQADSSSKRVHGGLGLGLAIVRHIVELHGGRVRAESAGEGQGATFTVELPPSLIRAPARPDRVHPQTSGGPAFVPSLTLAGIRILVVDDEPDTLEILDRVLTSCGAEVRTAVSAPEALAVLMGWTPQLLVSDIGMPGEDGYALIRHVRALGPERGGQMPALALTAYARVEDRLKVLSAGFQMHVAKPIEPAELVAVIGSLAEWIPRV